MTYFQELQSWLNGLKEGDEILVKTSNTRRIDKIKRITPSRQFILENHNERFNSQGDSIGSHKLYKSWLGKYTDEERASMQHEELARKVWSLIYDLNSDKIKQLPDKRLQELLTVLQSEKEQKQQT